MNVLKANGFVPRSAALLLSVVLLCLSMVPTAGAETLGSLSISYPIDGTVYHIYSVGSLDGGQIVMDEAFRNVDTSDYAAAAGVMADMVKNEDAAEELAAATVTDGKAVFHNLPMAIYLVLGDPGEVDDVRYWPTPFLLSVPQKDEQDRFVWDVSVTGKKELDVEITVVKKWVGDSPSFRPQSITVYLTRDGKGYGDPVELSASNNWTYTWQNLPPDEWGVAEQSNPRYTVSVSRQGNVFTITNTWKKIPQTGQLWWPVSALALTGLVFLCLGLIRRRESDANA